MKGFFPESDFKRQKQPLLLIPQCGACGLYKDCHSPKMAVSGKGKMKILIVAEAPGENEDRRGLQLVGNAGMELVRLLDKVGINMRRDCWLTNSVICRPTNKEGRNRTPSSEEIEFCRPNLAKTLNDLKPNVIVPLGGVACHSVIPLAWKEDGEQFNITRWAGWCIPSVRLNAYICPTYHPSYLLRAGGEEEGSSANRQAIEFHMLKHLRKITALEGKPWKEKPNYEQQVEIELDDEKAANRILVMMAFGRPMAFDLETSTLKPDGPHAKILCCSVSDGKSTLAFLWGKKVAEQMKIFAQSNIKKIGANLRFEERWFRKHLGCGVKNWWWDVVNGSHWLDCRSHISSVKFQQFVQFGVDDYNRAVEPFMKAANSNSPNQLHKVDRNTLLTYCGLDSLFEVQLAYRQMEGMQ